MHADLNGGRISWLEAGAASDRVLVLIHGFPFHAAIWKPQLDAPPEGWSVIAPDLRGFGESAPHDGTATMDAYAGDIAALLDHIGVKKAVLCGSSMGGYVLFAFLRRFSKRARAIVLCDTRPTSDTAEVEASRLQLITRVQHEGVGVVADTMLPRLLTHASRGTAVEESVRRIVESASATSIIAATQAMLARPDSTPLLRPLGALPTQIIVGADDAITPPGEARLMASAIPSAHIEVIPDAGHLPNIEQPRVFNNVLTRFLSGLPQHK
jgi:pimeloyl-ACP methyl ester carboxylesterase